MGMLTMLEGCRHHKIQHLIYASSSSVYGMNDKVPFSETDRVDNPVSFYAATKKANESMAASYSNLYGLKCTGLRFFTVYGPWGRPDMAPMLFADAILAERELKLFNSGKMLRDFTFIEDIVEGTIKLARSTRKYSHEVFNIGNSSPVKLSDFIETLEKELNKTSQKINLPMQMGDVTKTYADISKIQREIGYKPTTSIETGVKKFAKWYMEFYKTLGVSEHG